MTTFTLLRTGFPDLVFEGALLAEKLGSAEDSSTGNRWHDIAVYQSDDGEVIVSIRFHSQHADELSDDFVEVVSGLKDVEEVLSLYQPDIHFGREASHRQPDSCTRIAREVTRHYDVQVDAILRDLNSVKAVTIHGSE